MNELFPAFLNLTARKCLVIGGGTVAERKVKTLLRCQAEIHVVSPDLTSYLSDLVVQDQIIYFARKFLPEDLKNKFLIISAAGDREVNSFLASQLFENNFLLNIVDEPEKGNFFVPAVAQRGKLQIAVSTSGASPLLARKLRKQLEMQFGPEYERLLDILFEVRGEVIKRTSDTGKRKEIYQAIIESDILELIKNRDEVKVKERVNQCLS